MARLRPGVVLLSRPEAPGTGAGAPVISAWSAISPWGLTAGDFAAGLRSGRPTAAPLDRAEWTVPVPDACLVPGFDVRTELGRKGTRSMDRASGLAVAAVGRLLGGAGDGERLPGLPPDAGLVLGTTTGSAQSMMDFTRESLVGTRPYLVDPARFPSTVMNCAAGQAAIWHRLQGPNATVAAGRATGLAGLQYALRLHRAGRAGALLCGAVEEFSAARAWLTWHARAAGEAAPVLGEGAAVWLLEPAEVARAHGRTGLAAPVGLEFGFARDRAAIRPVLAGCLRRLLDRAGLAAADVDLVADSQRAGADGAAERAALADVLGPAGPAGPRRVGCADRIGDTAAASAAFQLAAVLACAAEPGAAAGRLALVTAAEAGGAVAAAAFRLSEGGRS